MKKNSKVFPKIACIRKYPSIQKLSPKNEKKKLKKTQNEYSTENE